MTRPVQFPLILALAWLLSACANSPPHLVSVEPELIKLRHGGSLTLRLTNADPDTQVSILPGGPFVRNHMSVNAAGPSLAITGDLIWLIQNQRTLNAYQASDGSFTPRQRIVLNHDAETLKAFHGRLYLTQGHALIGRDPTHPATEFTRLTLEHALLDFDLGPEHACLLQAQRLLVARLHSDGKLGPVLSERVLTAGATAVYYADRHCLVLDSQHGMRSFAITAAGLEPRGWQNTQGIRLSGRQTPLALADGAIGLSLLGHDHQGRLRWLGSYNRLGQVQHVARDGQRVLTADQNGVLSLFDISQPEAPRLLSDMRLPKSSIRALHLNAGIATVLTANALLSIDFQAEGSPAISALGVNLGGSRRAFIDGDHLFVADWFSGLHIYDIATPHAPRLLASLPTPGSPKGVLVRAGIAYLADDDHGLQIIDVSHVRQPRLLANLPLAGLAYTMQLRYPLLYLAAHRGGFHIIDVSNPRAPKRLGGYDTAGKSWALALKDNYALVADDNSGIVVFDISNPNQPQLSGQYNPGGHAEDILIDGDIAYAAFFDLGLHVLDISNPSQPRLIARLATPGNARGLDRAGNTLYLAAWDAGVLIIDITDPGKPRLIGHYDTRGSSWGLNARPPYVYVLDWWGGVRVLDARNPQRPVEIGRYQESGLIHRIAVHKRFAFAASGSRGLQVFDINNALNPIWATGVDFDGEALDIAISGHHALVAASDGGLAVVDIREPPHARWLAQARQPHRAERVLANHRHAFVASRTGGLSIYDIGNPAQPRAIASHQASINDLWLNGQQLWLATAEGLELLSVNNPSNPQSIFRLATGQPVSLIRGRANELYAIEGRQRLHHYRWQHGQLTLLASLTLPQAITDLQIIDDHLYLSAPDYALLLVEPRPGKLILRAEYPSSHRISALSFTDQALFFAGETRIASALRLPRFTSRSTDTGIILDIPPGLPLGSYHLMLRDKTGRQLLYHNAFKVGFPKPAKPRFTLEDLKRKLQQGQFEGKAPP